MDDKKAFSKRVGARLAEVRAAMPTPVPVRQADVESALGLNANNLSNWETGSHLPPTYHLANLCRFYGCSADYILGLRPRRYTEQQKQLLNKIESLDDHEQDAVEALVDTLLNGRQRSDG